MRVLIDYRPALGNRSGVGESTHQLARALLAAFPRTGAERPLDVTLFSSSWKERLPPSSDLAGASTVDRRVPVRLLNFAWHRLEWPPVETLAGGPFDVAHSPHPLLLPARDAAQVVTIHDLHFLEHPERTSAEIRRDYPTLVADHANRADRVLTPSTFTAREVEHRLGVPPDRITVCPHGAPDWPARAAAPHGGYILFLGTLEPRKNITGLLDAYERLISTAAFLPAQDRAGGAGGPGRNRMPELVLAGGATEEARPWLDRLTRPPLTGHVRHIGYVEPAARYSLYAGARLLVQPSFEEGFGLPVLEAMTVGVPVVASARGALPEVVGDAGPLVEPDDPTALAAAIARVVNDPAFAAACAARGLARARQFSWQKTAHLVYDAYEQAIRSRASARRSGH